MKQEIKNILIGAGLFAVVTFALQGVSHFLLFKNHFAAVGFLRREPIIAMGVLTMLGQGAVLAFVFSRLRGISGPLFGLLMALFFVSYIAVVEPGKYEVPSILEWLLVEGGVGLVQFLLFGFLLGITIRTTELT